MAAALVDRFLAAMAENLSGRRVLPRRAAELEPEPATLAQLPPYRAVQEAIARLQEGRRLSAVPATRICGEILVSLVAALERDPTLHVAEWPQAERVLVALEALINSLDVCLGTASQTPDPESPDREPVRPD